MSDTLEVAKPSSEDANDTSEGAEGSHGYEMRDGNP